MKLVWAPEALQDRMDIWDFIATDNPAAAARMDDLFSDSATRLAEHPKLDRPGKIVGTRELVVHKHYRLVYEISDDTVYLLTLIHTARLWPPAKT